MYNETIRKIASRCNYIVVTHVRRERRPREEKRLTEPRRETADDDDYDDDMTMTGHMENDTVFVFDFFFFY